MATNLGAYAGRFLYIDLTNKKYHDYPITDKDRELFLGGKILAARILNDFIKGPIDPLSSKNVVVITSCPLNGMACPSSSRFNISTISPLTNILTSSNCGGSFGLSLKRAGFDGVILVGASDRFINIEITEKSVKFLDAEKYRGMKTGEVQEAIGGKFGKLVIGPAGENMVRYACAVSDDRAAGRGGTGAVLGSKNVKAIIAKGVKEIKPYNREKLIKFNKKWVNLLKSHPLTGNQLPKLGTAALLSSMQQKHILATKNFSDGRFDGFRKISGEEMADKFLVENKGCLTCPIQCARVVDIDGKHVKGPEVEIMGLMGANILNDDLDKIIRWNYELDELGMDTISFAGTVAFAMELNEKGMWDNGLNFGETDNILSLIDDIAHRRGEVANLLAEGSKRLSDKFGGKDFCIQSKGMELSAYEPRGAVGQGLGYSVANRGGCHLNAGYLVVLEGLGLTINPYTTAGKAQLSIMFQNLMEAVSAGGNCLFTTYAFFPPFLMKKPNCLMSRIVNGVFPYLGPFITVMNKHPRLIAINLNSMLPHPKALTYAIGKKYNMGKLMEIGSRGYNLERMINMRLGIRMKDDSLPDRLTQVCQLKDNEKSKVPQAKLLQKYYKGRGWTDKGAIKMATLKKFKLDRLENIGERVEVPSKPVTEVLK